MDRRFSFVIAASLIMAAARSPVRADEPESKLKSTQEFKEAYTAALKGKTIAFVPQSLGAPLTDGWSNEMKKEAADLGMNYQVKDPNYDTKAMTQAVSGFIQSKPDILVVHNPNVQLYVRLLKQAQEAGIFVVQLNMQSNYKTDAFVGGDWREIAYQIGQDIVKTCGAGSGKSGKISVVEGELTSDVSILEMEGLNAAIKDHPEIQIVSDQAANWDSNKAREITATVVQQHPDLCAVFGHWGPMTFGAGQAVKAAGLSGKVEIYSTGENPKVICDAIKDKVLTRYWSVPNIEQGRVLMATIKYLLEMKAEDGMKPGQVKLADYTPVSLVTEANVDGSCW
jgi:ribose transport system substrate-binding protein